LGYNPEHVVRYIGIDAGESHRANKGLNGYANLHPLIEAGIDRDDCIDIIKQHGIPLPVKSSCFFCPNTKKKEVLSLAKKNPELAVKAIEMEANAKDNLKVVKGLGRDWSWTDLLANKQTELFDTCDKSVKIDCFCDIQ
jgi:hypothetical protein